ncbi:putative GTPase activating protein for arf domain-containing protein [Hirsutella rhossiliensis]|uniref:GTPase activating protein for arf domain-containing protein n=1 Tax=Hirsutella rhossiliensis TaxID=111463 RepID=A0A9P8SDL0_9HYPO|nr:putative GTPase activating protein for arf domain-containing protein [Hirsutella rhossiliensis]KAH0958711.1 putative GTPase activating protein for arf domain-containing protein [Hirsutella rhossiliensis]
MSRRAPNPAAERAAQNQTTIKSLLKLEPNKVCADCKRNKHPRWASWNLGIFVCIRCSGIHRGMGTHISRVKSVDLDSWTDEQLQSILSWGNARANKYWEAKLAAGHAPSEAKIENFIRTKYELKRWVMDGPMPDPASLDADGDDDVPLSLVKEKQAIEKKESIRKASVGQSQAPQGDLIGGDDPIPSRASTAGPAAAKVPSKAEPAAPKTTNTKDSLLGLDFLGEASAPPRPSSTPGLISPGGPSRPDLKQSILSLYASAPKPQPPPPQAAQRQGSFGGMVSPTMGHQHQGSSGGFSDAFGSLNISNNAPAPDPFAGLGGVSSSNRATSQPPSGSTFGGLSGGSFFDAKPTQPPAVSHQQKPSNSGFGMSSSFSTPFSSPPPTQPAVAPKPAQPSSSAMDDLFDLSSPVTQAKSPPPPTNAAPPASTTSVFNLSATQNKLVSSPPATATTTSTAMGGAGAFGADVWGGNEWSTPDTTSAAPPALKSPESVKSPASNMSWGGGGAFASTPIVPGTGGGFNPAPKVTADEEFGGWASSAGPSGAGGVAAPKPSGGLGGDDDLFSNVWQ